MNNSLAKSNTLTYWIVGLVVVAAIIAEVAYSSFADQDIAEVKTDDISVAIRGRITWDNYCMPRVITIQKNQTNTKNTFKLDSQPARPCKLAQPWVNAIDVNNDGYKDIQLLNMTIPDPSRKDKQTVYKTYIFAPSSNSFTAQ
jgi:hypothetical protein